ncbi:hypothetical protein Tco_0385999 [Tanacetum coccineum]
MAMLENVSNEWASVVFGIVLKPASNSIWSVIQRLVWGSVVYFLWQERNVRRVNNFFRSEDCLFKCIVETIRFKLMGLNLKMSADVLKAARIWNLAVNRDGFDADMVYGFVADDFGCRLDATVEVYSDGLGDSDWSQGSLMIQSVLVFFS